MYQKRTWTWTCNAQLSAYFWPYTRTCSQSYITCITSTYVILCRSSLVPSEQSHPGMHYAVVSGTEMLAGDTLISVSGDPQASVDCLSGTSHWCSVRVRSGELETLCYSMFLKFILNIFCSVAGCTILLKDATIAMNGKHTHTHIMKNKHDLSDQATFFHCTMV